MESSTKHLLFTYGTLQETEIQLQLFGRILKGSKDILESYRVGTIDLNHSSSKLPSNDLMYPIAIPSHDAKDFIAGITYELTPDELTIADEYEGKSYQRVIVVLKSGRKSWLYQSV